MTHVAKVLSVAATGFTGTIIEVESDTKKGLPNLQIVGLGNKTIDEAKERVKSAITNSFLEFPPRKVTVNLAPAELPKDGTHYDLPIALAILISSGQLLQQEVAEALFAGELSLDGMLRPIRSAITIAETARSSGIKTVYIPIENVAQARLVGGISIVGVDSLKSLYLHLKKEILIQQSHQSLEQTSTTTQRKSGPYIDEVCGQDIAKRALIVAAAGGHNIMLAGSPGAGKTMLAKTLANLLPPLTPEEQIAVTKLHSIAGDTPDEIMNNRPFRSPHHTASRASLVGGGTYARPGEISLAHLGVLFLDEIPEFPRSVLEALRQPLEDRQITVTRAERHHLYPADFMLVATMNPCPCGYYGDTDKECSCSSNQILAYQKRLSGPFLDRIDMVIDVPRIPHESILQSKAEDISQHIHAQKMIADARNIQSFRYGSSFRNNSNIASSDIRLHCNRDSDADAFLSLAAKKLHLSTRSFLKVIKVARTIADLDTCETINVAHISEALQYRPK